MQIGPHLLKNNLIVAPMAGVTDRPFRRLCKAMGAGMAVSEMISANAQLWNTTKSKRRADHEGEVDPISVQIAGADPAMMADAARYNVERGAQIIDINMGCPAKKVCNVAAGSALLQNEALVGRILDAVVSAVDVPVTLKIRTGWNPQNRNAVRIAKIAESAGIRALSVHGRTRACAFNGEAEYETIAEVKSEVTLPVIANGDIRHFLDTGTHLPAPAVEEIRVVLVQHLHDLYSLYGEYTGVRVARKHISWYTRGLEGATAFRQAMNQIESTQQQLDAVNGYFAGLAGLGERLTYIGELAA
jgi:tRNA-dihydrouridine synthase B